MKKVRKCVIALLAAYLLSRPVFAEAPTTISVDEPITISAAETLSYDGPLTVEAGENVVDFSVSSGIFSSYTVFMGQQGNVTWTGEENGTKDFSWNIDTPDTIAPESGRAYLNFPGTPAFVNKATVALVSPLSDGAYLYSYSKKDGFEKIDAEIKTVNDSDCFVFNTESLAETYVFSAAPIAEAEIPDETEVSEIVNEEIEEVSEEPEVTESTIVEDNADKNPETGVVKPACIIPAGIGFLAIVSSVVWLLISKKKSAANSLDEEE